MVRLNFYFWVYALLIYDPVQFCYSFGNVPYSRLHGLQDSMPISLSLTRTTSEEHYTALLLGCVTQNFLFVLTLSLLCALLWKPAAVQLFYILLLYIYLDLYLALNSAFF